MFKVRLYKMGANQDCISITCNPVRVSWTNCGEGINGDFDPHDPTDENLLRFDVSVNIEGEWVEKESRCTNFPANATLREKKCALEFIFNEFYMVLADDPTVSVRVLADIMSHIAPGCYPSTKMLATSAGKREMMIDTNIGKIPVPEYLDIKAQEYGFDSYEDLKAHGYHIDVPGMSAESLPVTSNNKPGATTEKRQDLDVYRVGEIIFDITTYLKVFTGKGAHAENAKFDSRDLYAHIFKWAEEFERNYGQSDDYIDYMTAIEEFAISKLRDYFAGTRKVSKTMRIKELRKKSGLTQQQLADCMNTVRSSVANWETGLFRPSAQQLPRLAKILGVTIEELYEEATAQNIPEIECDSESCAFCPDGICKYRAVYGRDPTLHDDGCTGYLMLDDSGIENLSALGQANKEKREFFVDTPVGKLKVHAKYLTDEPADYPGVYVDLVDQKENTDMLACVEFDSGSGNLQTCVYQPGMDEPVEVITHELPEEKAGELSFSAPWAYDGYEDWPLVCVRIPELEYDQVTELIKWFDVQYGNTNQDVSEWAVEFQVLIRNLTHDGFLLVNPRRLQVDEVADQLEDILTDKQLSIYKQARRLSREELIRLAAEQNG